MKGKERWKSSLSRINQVNNWRENSLPSSKYAALATFSEIRNVLI